MKLEQLFLGVFFVLGFTVNTRLFCTLLETLPILVKGYTFLTMLDNHIAIEQWGIFNIRHLLVHGTSVYMIISKTRWHSHLLPSTITTCFINVGLFLLGIKPQSSVCRCGREYLCVCVCVGRGVIQIPYNLIGL